MSNGKSNAKLDLLMEKIKNNKKLQYFIVTLLVLIIVVYLFFSFYQDKNVDDTSKNYDTISLYVYDLENRISNALSKVDGAGTVSVVITVSSGMETVLATETVKTETATGIEISETPIIINGKTVVIKEAYPAITGVLIVAQGANNFSVLSRLQQAVMSLLDVELDQVEILAMK